MWCMVADVVARTGEGHEQGSRSRAIHVEGLKSCCQLLRPSKHLPRVRVGRRSDRLPAGGIRSRGLAYVGDALERSHWSPGVDRPRKPSSPCDVLPLWFVPAGMAGVGFGSGMGVVGEVVHQICVRAVVAAQRDPVLPPPRSISSRAGCPE